MFGSKFGVGMDTSFLGPKSKLLFYAGQRCLLFPQLCTPPVWPTIPQRENFPGASQIITLSFNFNILSLCCKPYWGSLLTSVMKSSK